MKKALFVMMIGTAALVSSCGNPKAAEEQLVSGINPEYLDTTVSPTEDFYQYACGGWMAKNPLTDEYARFGTFPASVLICPIWALLNPDTFV